MRPIAWTSEMIKTTAEMLADGHGTRRIAVRLGLGKSTVSQFIERNREAFDNKPRSYIGNDRWVDRVPYTTISGAVVSLPRISILNGKEG